MRLDPAHLAAEKLESGDDRPLFSRRRSPCRSALLPIMPCRAYAIQRPAGRTLFGAGNAPGAGLMAKATDIGDLKAKILRLQQAGQPVPQGLLTLLVRTMANEQRRQLRTLSNARFGRPKARELRAGGELAFGPQYGCKT